MARVGQIWRRSRWAVFLYVLVFAPLGFGTTLAADHPWIYGATLAFFALSGFVRWRKLHVGQLPSDPDGASRWLRSFANHTRLSALVWGAFACYMQIAYQGVFLQFAILLITAGIGCFALGAFAGERKMTFSFLACVMVPTLTGLAYGWNGEALVLLCMMILFLGAIAFQVVEINDWFVRSTVESLLLERSRKEAEAAARVKSEFLANMSHELRTPMNGVMGMLELLLQSNLDREQKLLARTSHRSAESLLDILNDILDFSKMSAGKMEFVRLDFQPRNAIEDVYDLLGPRALEKGVDLGYRIDPGVPEWVCGDEGRLRQVLMNLVSNAIKFSHSGEWPTAGSVSIEARLVSQDDATVHIAFDVADQGQGMSARTLANLFEPFMQADTSTSRRFGGTGLGLAISRQLVSAMGGTISAESVEHHGARFTFDIKLAPSSRTRATTPPAAPGPVLVIEPAPLSRETIGNLLRRHGVTPLLTASLEEAARHLAASPVRAVFAGTSAQLGPSSLRTQLQSLLPAPALPVFLIYNRGDAVEDDFPRSHVLHRPVRSAQIAEALVVADCLPRATVPTPTLPSARLAGHVLIAEDNAVNQMLAQRLVAALGLTSEVVPNGEAAVEALLTGRFLLVLMDCQMPGLDGYEATRRLRQLPQTKELPVVAMTANAMKGDRELCLAAGMTDYVSKPIRLERLREVLSRYLPAAPVTLQSESSK